ncbi:MAG TPA: FliI/YscN family ATPase [Steroidobacter sp.]
MHALTRAVADTELIARAGHVVAVRGHIVESTGPAAQIGERCRIETSPTQSIDAEVVGFNRGIAVLMPLGGVEGISLGERVVALGRLPDVPVGRQLLGRVVDAFGQAADDGAALDIAERRALRARAPRAMQRQRVNTPLETGVKVIDSMLTLARGQRVGLFAGSGVGKSTLMGMLARSARSTVNVIALIGERSREVREFVEDQLGAEGLSRSVVVVATPDETAVVRSRAAYAATTIAEYFRDQGEDVLLMMDSLTRFAMARREIGLAVGEPPTARGYTPSVFSELPQLCERSGPGAGVGSITGVYTVLVDGDDMNEPVSDTLRATLDGHIVLSRDIANAGQYPAVDVLQSVSRLHTKISQPADVACARNVLASCALYERNRQLIEIGAYKPGVNPTLDRTVQSMSRVRSFFSQATEQKIPRADSLAQLKALSASLGGGNEIQ